MKDYPRHDTLHVSFVSPDPLPRPRSSTDRAPDFESVDVSSILAGGAHFSMQNETTRVIQLLLSRLERIPVDSPLAHRAGGIRGALLRVMSNIEMGLDNDKGYIQRIIDKGFEILYHAAYQK